MPMRNKDDARSVLCHAITWINGFVAGSDDQSAAAIGRDLERVCDWLDREDTSVCESREGK